MPTSGPKPVTDVVRFRWDIILFTVFIASAVPAVTRVAIHEWLGLAFVAVVLVHLLFNWPWIVGIGRRFFRELPGEVRFNYFLDALLFVLFSAVTVSGLLISEVALPTIGLAIRRDLFWRSLHDISTTLLMIVFGVHLAMHMRWLIARLTPGLKPPASEKEAPEKQAPQKAEPS